MARNARDIRFATFNLRNLHLPGKPIYSDRNGWSQAEYDAKLQWSASILKQLDADVIGFQELWDGRALDELFERAELQDSYDRVTREQGSGISVALAARRGLLRKNTVEWIADFPETCRFAGLQEARDAKETVSISIDKFSRPLLKAVIQPKGANPKPPAITVYVAHLKSKAPATLRPDADNPILKHHGTIARSVVSHVRRIVEAGALRAILHDVMKDNNAPFVVIGDLNDATTSVSTELITANPGYRFFAKSRAGGKSDTGLYTVEKLQQLRSFQSVYFTHIHENKMESLDHILVSDCFYDNAVGRRWSFREMRVFNDHLVFESAERILFGTSDHGAVSALFEWNPAPDIVDDE